MVFPTDENVIVGLDRADDAGVYKISDDLALIQTVDFFTPIVDDPYWFGQIAAANALSDVYAMGGTPKTAMNLVAFPIKQMDIAVLRQIIQGGLDKLTEAEVVLIGGHGICRSHRPSYPFDGLAQPGRRQDHVEF
jgi:selenide,water dikinase